MDRRSTDSQAKCLEVSLFLQAGVVIHHKLIPSPGSFVHKPLILIPDTYIYFWVERSTARVKCPAKEHNTGTPAGRLCPKLSIKGPTLSVSHIS